MYVFYFYKLNKVEIMFSMFWPYIYLNLVQKQSERKQLRRFSVWGIKNHRSSTVGWGDR